jgi:hypothetical protein
MFIPAAVPGRAKFPAIIYCSGHSATGYRSYQKTILNLVNKGFVVFAFDPMGQGERSEYYNDSTRKLLFRWPAWEHSYAGAQLFMTGNTLARNFIWDGSRAIDYLETRSEVDVARIGITGRSGGGTQSAYIAAFDERIKAVAPENYLTNYKTLIESIGPQDAEQNFFYGIQRGLDMADLLAVRAPKPALLIATSQDMFPIQGAMETAKEIAQVYKLFGQPGNFAMVSDDAPHASTKKNREAMYAFFQKYLDNPGNASDEELPTLTADELQVAGSLKTETAYSLNRADAIKKLAGKQYSADILNKAKQLSGYVEPRQVAAPQFRGRFQRDGYSIEKYVLQGGGNYVIPYLLFKPASTSQAGVIYLHPEGKFADTAIIKWLVSKGVTVLAPDMIGTGEMGPGAFRGDSFIDSVSYNIWFTAMLTGTSIVGIQSADVARLVRTFKSFHGIKNVYGIAQKQMSPVLLHAAAFEPGFDQIALISPYSSYRSMVMLPRYEKRFLHSTVPGAIGVYDLPDLAAALAPKKLLIAGPTDGNGEINSDTGVDMQVIKNAYKKHPSSLQIISSTAELYQQLDAWLNRSF